MGEIMLSEGADDRAGAPASAAALPAGGWSPLLGEIALALEVGLREAGAVHQGAKRSAPGLGEVPVLGTARDARGRDAAPAVKGESRAVAIVPAGGAAWTLR